MMIEITATIVLALGSFIVSEHLFEASGIIATVVAGLTFSVFGKENFSAEVKHFAKEIWEYISFVSNSFVFLLVGITFGGGDLINHWQEIVIVFLIILLSRAISVYGLGWVHNKYLKRKDKISQNWLHIINWGGLRGALPIAFILSLKEFTKDGVLAEYADTIITYTLGVIILSLLINVMI